MHSHVMTKKPNEMGRLSRRAFVVGCLGMLAGTGAQSAELVNPYSLVYLRRGSDQGWVNLDTEAGYQSFRWLLRDVKTGTVGYPPQFLGYILSWMQTFLRVWGHDLPIEITSGLRLPSTNARTEGAARSSLHIPDRHGYFRAVDVKICGIPGEYTGRLAALAQRGGVGFYGDQGHTHIDIGAVRYWRKLPKS